jgi:hypothetical protein
LKFAWNSLLHGRQRFRQKYYLIVLNRDAYVEIIAYILPKAISGGYVANPLTTPFFSTLCISFAVVF